MISVKTQINETDVELLSFTEQERQEVRQERKRRKLNFHEFSVFWIGKDKDYEDLEDFAFSNSIYVEAFEAAGHPLDETLCAFVEVKPGFDPFDSGQ